MDAVGGVSVENEWSDETLQLPAVDLSGICAALRAGDLYDAAGWKDLAAPGEVQEQLLSDLHTWAGLLAAKIPVRCDLEFANNAGQDYPSPSRGEAYNDWLWPDCL